MRERSIKYIEHLPVAFLLGFPPVFVHKESQAIVDKSINSATTTALYPDVVIKLNLRFLLPTQCNYFIMSEMSNVEIHLHITSKCLSGKNTKTAHSWVIIYD